MKIYQKFILTTLFFSCFFLSQISATRAFAATYYVDKDSIGGSCNDSNAGTAVGFPLCTFSKAHSKVVAGDTVYFRQGTYPPMYITKSGTVGAYITFASYPGELAVIDAAGTDYGIRAELTRYVEVNGFEVKNAGGDYSGGIYIKGIAVAGTDYTLTQSSHNRVMNNIVHDNKKGAHWTYGIRVASSSYNLIQNNKSYNNFKCGITVEFDNGIPGLNNHLIGNEVFNNADGGGDADGICVYGNQNKGMLIQGNTIYNNGDDGIDTWSSSGTIIEKNLVYGHVGTGDGNGIKSGGSTTGGENIVRYNIAYGNKANGFDSNGSGGNQYYNNVAFNNGAYGFEDGWRNEPSTGCAPMTDRCKTVLKNNIGFNNTLGNLSANDVTKVSDYNLWFSTNQGSKISFDYVTYSTLSSFRAASGAQNLDQHSISLDPKFIDAINHNFHLKPDSPAINTGIQLGLDTDFEGNPIVSIPDIGAYEFNETVTNVCVSDINIDGIVDLTDYSILVQNFFKTDSEIVNPRADINDDGIVDLTDYSSLVKDFFKSISSGCTIE